MSEIDDKLNEKLRQQMDGLFDEDEEQRLRLIANRMLCARTPLPCLAICVPTKVIYIMVGRATS